MSKTIVTRPVNGIMINGELEFLLNDSGEIRVFDSPEQAKSFLIRPTVQEPFGWLCLPVLQL